MWLQENSEALSRLQRLSQLLPASQGLEALVAQAHYNLQVPLHTFAAHLCLPSNDLQDYMVVLCFRALSN